MSDLLELIGRLEELAAKATPGDRKWQDRYHYGDPNDGPDKNTLTAPRAEPIKGIGTERICVLLLDEPPENLADAEFIAALDPATVLALCTAARRSVAPDEVVAAAKTALSRWRPQDYDPPHGESCQCAVCITIRMARWIASLTPEAASGE